ncbi:DNA-directed DNA polymerase [Chytriomyces hyalinus]|nr:DNA-directed DNA polymerase [Chytriomyces hyalinus]
MTASVAPVGSSLEVYWHLTSLDASARLVAAQQLATTVEASVAAHTASVSDSDKTEKTESDSIVVQLQHLFGDDAAYALKRLVRGLASSRDGARLGFTLALAQVLHVLALPEGTGSAMSLDDAVALIDHLNPVLGAGKGQEERESYFANIFGMHAIVQSGLVTASQTTPSQISRLVKSLLTCANAKSYLSLACYNVLLQIAVIGVEAKSEWLESVITDVAAAGMGVEGVWFAIALQETMRTQGFKFDWKTVFKGTWDKPNSILHIAHKTRLVNVLKETTTTSPKLHPIFPVIISHIFESSNPTLTLQDFWTHMIDEPLFNSTHDRKFIGFLVFQKCLEAASASTSKHDVGVLFSKSFLRCLINSLGKGDDAVLFKIAKATAKQISTISSSSREIGLQVVFQLIGKHGHQRFDSITHTKTVESIVGSLNEAEVESYVKYLTDMVIHGGAEGLNKEEAATVKSMASTRMWALDQLHSLLKAPKIPKSEGWIQKVLRFLCVHSLFVVEKSGGTVQAIEGGDLGSSVREYCRGRFFAGLAEVNGISLMGPNDKKLPAGVMLNGEYWAHDLIQFILELDGTGLGAKKNSNGNAPTVRAVHSLEARSLEARNMAVKEIASFRTHVLALQKAKDARPAVAAASPAKSAVTVTDETANLIAQYKSFELLFLHVLLQVYTEPVDAVNILNELKSCSDLVFTDNQPPVSATPTTPTAAGSKKRKAEAVKEVEENEDEQHNPIDVIVDILLSFLAKPSALFRGVVENVFRVFCPVMTASGLELIFDILKAKSGVAGAQELFEQEGENDDDDGDDDVEEIDGANGEDDDEDSDEDESSEDSESDQEEDEEEVDAFRNKLTAALGGMIVDGAAEEDETEPAATEDADDALGDDDMEAFDDKLAEIFRERKKLKVEKRDTKQQVLHFKLRAVDLLEIFIKKQPTNPLVLHLLVPSLQIILESGDGEDSRELYAKMTHLVKTKLATIREYPRLESVEQGCLLLKEIHELAATKAPSMPFVSLASSLSLVVVRAIAHAFPDAVVATHRSVAPAVSVTSTPKQKSKKQKKAAEKEEAPVKTVGASPVAEVYCETVKEFLSKKKSKLQPSLFLDLCNRHAAIGLQVLPAIALAISAGEVEKGFKVIQGFNIMAACLQKLPVKETAAHEETLSQFQTAFCAALISVTKVNEEKGVTIGRIRELNKPVVAIAKRLKKSHTDDPSSSGAALFAETRKAIESGANSPEELAALGGILAAL